MRNFAWYLYRHSSVYCISVLLYSSNYLEYKKWLAPIKINIQDLLLAIPKRVHSLSVELQCHGYSKNVTYLTTIEGVGNGRPTDYGCTVVWYCSLCGIWVKSIVYQAQLCCMRALEPDCLCYSRFTFSLLKSKWNKYLK